MAFNYNQLWKTLQKENITVNEFSEEINISASTVSKLKKNENVSLDTLDKICTFLECDISDIINHESDNFDDSKLFYRPLFDISSSLNTVSLFSGAGGLDIGLIEAGFNVVYANDNYAPAVENYGHNIGTISSKDLTEVSIDEIPDCDVVVGGFPCQPFSSAGNRLGTEDDRGNLYLEMIRIIEAKNPKFVIMENVRGLLSMKNKDGSLLIDTIISLLEETGYGYNVSYKLLRSSDYGVPQERYRVFIVGVREDMNFTYEFPEPYNIDKEKLTVDNIIDIPENIFNSDEVWDLSPQSQHLVKFIPEGGSWKDVPYEELPERLKKIRNNMKKYRSPNFYRRYARYEINGTITAAATPENCGIIHPLEDRRYSVREIARIQSFPDTYEFIGHSIPNKYKLIGNAVPPKMATAVGNSLVKQIYVAENQFVGVN